MDFSSCVYHFVFEYFVRSFNLYFLNIQLCILSSVHFCFIFNFFFHIPLLFRRNVHSCSIYAMPVAGEINRCAVLSTLVRYSPQDIVHHTNAHANLSNSIWNANRKASSNIYESVIGVQHPNITSECLPNRKQTNKQFYDIFKKNLLFWVLLATTRLTMCLKAMTNHVGGVW